MALLAHLLAYLLIITNVTAGPFAGLVSIGCEASGSSDGVSAEAVAVCSVHPDGLILQPLHPDRRCPVVSYELAVPDDTAVAVFANSVVADYSSGLDPAAALMDGSASNYGTVLDVLGSGDPGRPTGIALDLNFGNRRFSATGRWWRRICWVPDPAAPTLLVRDSLDGPYPEGDEVLLSQLIAEARARVDPPPVPAFEHSGPASILQLPTWFWANQQWWETPYRGEQTHGRVTVAVSAVPVDWQLTTDGFGVGCSDRGVAWSRGSLDRDGCTHTFLDPVEGGSASIQFTVRLAVHWSASIPGYGVQTLPPIYRSVDQTHQVVEVIGLRG